MGDQRRDNNSPVDLDLDPIRTTQLRNPSFEVDSQEDFPGNFLEPSWLVYVAVLCAQMSTLSLGCSLGWSAPALDDMNNWDQTSFKPTDSQANTIASLLLIGAMVGAVFCGFFIDRFGRRKTLIGLGIPYGIGWLMIGLSKSLAPILIGRIFTGISVGMTTGVLPAYVAEISTPNTRGFLGMAYGFFLVAGIFFMDLVYIGNVHWNQLALWGLAPALLLSGSMLLMPESPSWIVNHCKDSNSIGIEEALKSLRKLRSRRSDIYQELEQLIENSKRLQQSSDSELRFSMSTLRRADVYKPMSIGIALLFFQQFCGLNAVQFYANQIFEDSGSSIEPKYCTLISNTAMLVATIVGGFFIDRFGRRILMIISGVGLMLSIGTLGIYYKVNESSILTTATMSALAPSTLATLNNSLLMLPLSDSPPVDRSSVLPVICVTLYFCSYALGLGPIAWIIITEITPPQTTGLISTVSSAVAWIFTFLVVNEANDMFRWFSPQGTYWIFAIISIASAVFAYCMPETKGKTMQQIVKIFDYEH